jgi:hypothetical protein
VVGAAQDDGEVAGLARGSPLPPRTGTSVPDAPNVAASMRKLPTASAAAVTMRAAAAALSCLRASASASASVLSVARNSARPSGVPRRGHELPDRLALPRQQPHVAVVSGAGVRGAAAGRPSIMSIAAWA